MKRTLNQDNAPDSETPRIISVKNYCDACLGRIFSSVSTGLTNTQRGLIVRSAFSSGYGLDLNFSGKCSICEDILLSMDNYLEMTLSAVRDYSFSSFRVGSVFSGHILENEKTVHDAFGTTGETVKKEFNRELGKLLSSSIDAEYEPDRPEMEITVDTRYDTVTVRAESIFIYGTYRKLVRGIPQTRWIHGTGDTVESLIGEPLKEMLSGTGYFLHGAGREDVDVRMLGNGREFVIEVSGPKKRSPDIRSLRYTINNSDLITVHNLRVVTKETVAQLKLSRHDKTYRVRVEGDSGIDMGRMRRAVIELNGKIIYQRTPLRVSRRRADLIRERRLLNSRLLSGNRKSAVIEITAEAGTYIKELVSGDRGRTNPSLSSVYNAQLRVIELDVTRIHR